MGPVIPSHLRAIRYNSPADFEFTSIPVPSPKSHEVLIRVRSCGICGTDLHIHDGDFEVRVPVVTGHETSGEVVKVGDSVTGFQIGDKVTADSTQECGSCYQCQEGQILYCEKLQGHGTQLDGGFAEYCVFSASKLFHITNLSWAEASVAEAAACAIHGVDRIRPALGCTVLQLGAGPTGLCLSQLFKGGGAVQVVMASHAGLKLDLARSLDVANEYYEIDTTDLDGNWTKFKNKYARGFDIVVEATGDVALLEESVDLCAKGGTLVLYGVYPPNRMMTISPSKLFLKEMTLITSFSEMYCLPRAVKYLESGKIKIDGIVTHTYSLEKFGEALQAIRQKKCVKATIVME